MNLESLKLLQSSPSKVIFDAGSGTRLVIEPHAPGMYRIRFGAEASVATDSPTSARAKLHADLLVARPEAIFEMETEALPNHTGWRLAQADTALVIGQAPFGISVMRGEQVLLALTEDGISNEEEHWSFGFPLKAHESIYGLGQTLTDLNRRGEYVVSDDPEHRALPFAWSPSGSVFTSTPWGVLTTTWRTQIHPPMRYMLKRKCWTCFYWQVIPVRCLISTPP